MIFPVYVLPEGMATALQPTSPRPAWSSNATNTYGQVPAGPNNTRDRFKLAYFGMIQGLGDILTGSASVGRRLLLVCAVSALCAVTAGCGQGSASDRHENASAVPLTLTTAPLHFRAKGWKVVGGLPSLRLKGRLLTNVNRVLRHPFLSDLSSWRLEIKGIGADHPGQSNGGWAAIALQEALAAGQFTASSRVASELVLESFCSDFGTADCSDNTSRTVLVPSGRSISLRDLFARRSRESVPPALAVGTRRALVHQGYRGTYRPCMTKIQVDRWGAYNTFSLGRNGLWIAENVGGACSWPVVFVSYQTVGHELSAFGRSIVSSVRRPKLV